MDFFALVIAPDDLLVAYGLVAVRCIETKDVRASLLWIELKIQSTFTHGKVERTIWHIEPFSLIGNELEGEFLTIWNKLGRHVQLVSRLGIIAGRLELPLWLANGFFPIANITTQENADLAIQELRMAARVDGKNPTILTAVVTTKTSAILWRQALQF